MKRLLVLVCLLVLIGLLVVANSLGNPACSGRLRHDSTLRLNGQTIYVQRANTAAEQSRGLGGLPCIGKNEGMLFTFDKADYYQFWMKDMHFPIEIIWLGDDKKVVTDLNSVQPSSYPTTFVSDHPARYVLELSAGQAPSHATSVGQQLQF